MFPLLFSPLFILLIEFSQYLQLFHHSAFLSHNQTNYIMHLNIVIHLFPPLYISKLLIQVYLCSLRQLIAKFNGVYYATRVHSFYCKSSFCMMIYRPTADERGQSQTLMLHSQGRMSGSLKQFHCFDSHVDNNCDTLTYGRVVVEFISIMTL